MMSRVSRRTGTRLSVRLFDCLSVCLSVFLCLVDFDWLSMQTPITWLTFLLTFSLEMAQRLVDRKGEQATHATLIQANYEETQARHQYAAQHPAYADGRVW